MVRGERHAVFFSGDTGLTTEYATIRERLMYDVKELNVKAGKKIKLTFAKGAALPDPTPLFNASLDGEQLVYKKYFHIGFAADTPNGLVVPVIKNADTKSVFEIAAESGSLAKLARDGKLKPADMSGACFTISSLGGIGGGLGGIGCAGGHGTRPLR